MPSSRLALLYSTKHNTLVSWCELRDGLRNFPADRVVRATLLDDIFLGQGDSLRALWVDSWHPT